MAITNGITNTSLVGDLRLAQMLSQEIDFFFVMSTIFVTPHSSTSSAQSTAWVQTQSEFEKLDLTAVMLSQHLPTKTTPLQTPH